jgi:hypothetical protein
LSFTNKPYYQNQFNQKEKIVFASEITCYEDD